MDQPSLEFALADLNLPAIRYYKSVGSTNDEAFKWVNSGAPDQALVIADEQTSGRGRSQRQWITTPNSGLAFSLILLSPPFDPQMVSRLSGLGAVAVRRVLQNKYGLRAQIKWPNDILLDQLKAGGVLVEARWSGEILKAVIVGIGINIAPEAISAVNLPQMGLNFPPTCVENALGSPVDRLELLHAILQEFLSWLPRLSQPGFIDEWESNLAFRDQWVVLYSGDYLPATQKGNALSPHEEGKVIGLTQDGSLQLLIRNGALVTATVGELHLRPATINQPFPPLD
jgi:BirA family transcriptional regulator, biotin operon repressor / biotin---[acetyl-CoA-carboxylase] ligase